MFWLKKLRAMEIPLLKGDYPMAATRRGRRSLAPCKVVSSLCLLTLIMVLRMLAILEEPFSGYAPTIDRRIARNADGSNYIRHVDPLDISLSGPTSLAPERLYQSNGYLRVSCNGGLNQMRGAICDMVAIARLMNVTLVVPELDKKSFWADPSDFKDIFDVKHFIRSLRGEVRVVESLPADFNQTNDVRVLEMPPVSWSCEEYYMKKVLPLFRKHGMVHFLKTDSRLANNGISKSLQRLRCKVNFESLRFTPAIEALGKRVVSRLLNDRFIVLHLRYEMDMLAFSGCTRGCSPDEAEELKRMRYAIPWWKEKEIDSEKKRLEGSCPLTPEETALVLQALGIASDTTIYIASGDTYGGEKRMAAMRRAYPNIVRKEDILTREELLPFQNRSSQMAALDFMIAAASDIFIPTYDGNMGRLVEGHRRFFGFRETIQLDRKKLVPLIDLYEKGSMSWESFSSAVQKVHRNKRGQPARRNVKPRNPKEEDNFYANPHECLPSVETF